MISSVLGSRRFAGSMMIAGTALVFSLGVANAAPSPGECPGKIQWVPAPKIGQVLAQDSGMPEFNPAKHLNQVSYVGRFVLVPQVAIVVGLPKRPLALISGLDAPKLRIAERVHEVEWRMINASDKTVDLKIKSMMGKKVVQCALPGARMQQKKGKRFAYLRWFWKPAMTGRYTYRITMGDKHVSGTIVRTKIPLRYGE